MRHAVAHPQLLGRYGAAPRRPRLTRNPDACQAHDCSSALRRPVRRTTRMQYGLSARLGRGPCRKLACAWTHVVHPFRGRV